MSAVAFHPAIFLVGEIALLFIMLGGLIMIVWSIIWTVKHPIKREYCKECGQLKPLKYDQD
jgi:hypothetical protein